jgi:hypothetical protein
MDKQQLLDKTAETLRPFETANLMNTIQNLTLKDIFSNPAVLICILALLFFGIIRRSKVVLLTLFALIAFTVLIRYVVPAPDEALSVKALLPFVSGGIVIAGVIIYYTFIRSK